LKRVHVLVEGQTEETFVNQILHHHLTGFGVHLTPVLIVTKLVKSGPNFKGGVTTYRHVRKGLQRLLNDSSVAAVTTMIDYYGLPPDFPGLDRMPEGRTTCYQRVEHLQKALEEDLGDRRLLPYFSLHEFEALLLVAPGEIGRRFPESAAEIGEQLRDAVDLFESPEEVNDGDETHPAARLLRLAPTYRKALHGPVIAERIGIGPLRDRCPHFDRWVSGLERLGEEP
jgi:hypothetical protein